MTWTERNPLSPRHSLFSFSMYTHAHTHTQVDMPVFFYIDPDFNDDPAMAKVDTITLSYTFFESRDGDFINLPVPSRQM